MIPFRLSSPFAFLLLFFRFLWLASIAFFLQKHFLLYINIPTGHIWWTFLFDIFIPFLFVCVGEAASLSKE